MSFHKAEWKQYAPSLSMSPKQQNKQTNKKKHMVYIIFLKFGKQEIDHFLAGYKLEMDRQHKRNTVLLLQM